MEQWEPTTIEAHIDVVKDLSLRHCEVLQDREIGVRIELRASPRRIPLLEMGRPRLVGGLVEMDQVGDNRSVIINGHATPPRLGICRACTPLPARIGDREWL